MTLHTHLFFYLLGEYLFTAAASLHSLSQHSGIQGAVGREREGWGGVGCILDSATPLPGEHSWLPTLGKARAVLELAGWGKCYREPGKV